MKKMIFYNSVKSVIAILFSIFMGYLLYFFILRGANEDDPNGAAVRTIIFSLFVFIFSVFVMLKITKAESKSGSESLLFKNDFRQSGYSLNYNEYFKKALKQRLWGYYIGPALFQIPLIINFIIVSKLPEKITIYEYPLSIYKWSMSSLFAYEIFGGLWILGFIFYMAAFATVFSIALYFSFKSFFTRPSYM